MIRRIAIGCLGSLFASVLLGATLWLTHGLWLNAVGRWLVVNQQPEVSDAAVAISGHNRRRRHAMKLYQQGYVEHLIFNVSDTTYYFGEPIDPVTSVVEDLHAFGIPVDSAHINRDVISTRHDALATLETMREQGLNSLIVISAPFHMRRVKMTYDRVMDGSGIRLIYCSVPLEKEKIELDRWWTREREFLLVFNEYLKIAYYYYKYFL